MKTATKRILVLSVLVCEGLLVSSSGGDLSFTARKYYGARLEPRSSIIHGAGQSRDALSDYTGALPGTPPLITMHYWNVKDAPEPFLGILEKEILEYEARGIYLIPQIGLQMTTDGKAGNHFENRVAAGDYDGHLLRFLTGLGELGRPAFIRIGFEFNGLAWNGYEPEPYKEAWIRITKMIRDTSPEIATVWCAAIHSWVNPPTLDNARYRWMEYYPGDEWVDWWGIDTFEKEEFKTGPLREFLKEADTRGKPVMIGESTPKKVGVLRGDSSWKAWFDPWFRTMADHPGIKAFCYINWDWSRYPQWGDWGDARLQQNKVVRERYAALMENPLFLHGRSEPEVRRELGISGESSVPPGKPGFTVRTLPDGNLRLEFARSGKETLLRRVIYRNGIPAGYATGPVWEETYPVAGEKVSYTVRAVSRAGEPGPLSDPQTVTFPAALIKTRGGEFSESHGFYLRLFEGGNARFFVGGGAARVEILNPTGTNWHIQLVHPLGIRVDRIYRFEATLSASRECPIQILFQKQDEPYTVYQARTEKIGPSPRKIVIGDFRFPAGDDIFLTFMMGSMPAVTVTLDDITVEERLP